MQSIGSHVKSTSYRCKGWLPHQQLIGQDSHRPAVNLVGVPASLKRQSKGDGDEVCSVKEGFCFESNWAMPGHRNDQLLLHEADGSNSNQECGAKASALGQQGMPPMLALA
eukprot:174126-Pelagomonas_calceolata.AAC.4